MIHSLLEVQRIDQPPGEYLAAAGDVFAVFDDRCQDSGNISYGIRIDGQRFFVKTAGRPDDPQPSRSPGQRAAWLRNAVRIWRSCPHPAMVRLHGVIESPAGPILVYEWVEGELLRCPAETRNDPASSFQRFAHLPPGQIAEALDVVYDLHAELARRGWIAVDFYDGCILYDFARQQVRIMDLDMYHLGPFVNEMGWMFGSSRFMAPEEFTRGAPIDQRTNVFTMGRTAAVLLGDGSLERSGFRGSAALHAVVQRACAPERACRHESMAAFHGAWREARDATGCLG